MRKNTTHNLTVAAMLSAVAFILMFIEFPIPMLIPSFVKMDFSDLPELLAAFAYGPLAGVAVAGIKNLIHLPLSSSMYVGELSNFLLGAVLSVAAGAIYKKHKTKRGALAAAVLLTAAGESEIYDSLFANRFACAAGFAAMGAACTVRGRQLTLPGGAVLHGTDVTAPDLRGGAALLAAALAADGELSLIHI